MWGPDFDPSSVLFKPRDRHLILLSNVGIGAMLSLLAFWARTFGAVAVFKFYVLPYLWVNVRHCSFLRELWY